MKIRAITVIWGADFVEMFLRVGLRTLIAEGNLPDLAKRHCVLYSIYTTAEDAQVIQASPAFAHLSERIDVRFTLFSTHEIDIAHFGSHNELWTRGVELARRNQETVFLLIPDVLYSKGTLVHWASRFEAGTRAIYTPGPQVVLETVMSEIEAGAPDPSSAITIERKKIADLLIRHFHPIHCGMLRETHRRIPFAEFDVRPIEQRGFVLRELSAQPFCFDPSYFQKFANFSPTDRLDAVETVACSVLSVEPLMKRADWSYRPWHLDGLRLSQLGGWGDFFCPPGCIKDSSVAHEFCTLDDDTWRAGIRGAIAGGRFFRAQMHAAMRIYRLFVALQARGLRRSATMLATALYVGRLRRRLILRDEATLLVPVDAAFNAEAERLIARALEPGREQVLVDIIRDHVLPASAGVNLPGLETARKLPLGPLAENVNVLSGPIRIDGFTIYTIDKVLWRERPSNTKSRPTPATSKSRSTPATSNSRSTSDPIQAAPRWIGAWGVSAWARSSATKRILYFALHIPIVEPFVALLLYRRKKYLNLGISIGLYRVYTSIEPFPIVGGAVRLLRSIYRIWRTQGARTLVARILGRIPGGTFIGKAIRRVLQVIRLARIAIALVKEKGFVATTTRTVRWLRRKLIGHPLPACSLRVFQQIRIARSLMSIEDGLCYYALSALPPGASMPPLDLVRDLLDKSSLSGDSGNARIERALLALLASRKDWAECWLELGHLRADAGQMDKAIECYTHASDGVPLSDPPKQSLDPRIEAHIARARLLNAKGFLEAAAHAYASALQAGRQLPAASAEYGNLLRRLGHTAKAVDYYDAAVAFEEPHWYVPKTGRDSTKITFLDLQSISATT